MKVSEFLKVATVTAMTAGFAVGCASGGSETSEPAEPVVTEEADCETPPEVRNAIYAAKLKNARVRNLGYEWRDTAKIIATAEEAAEKCQHVRAKILADKAADQADAAIAQHKAEMDKQETMEAEPEATSSAGSQFLGGYLVVSGDNLWDIAGQDGVYGNPYQWPLIYKANSGQINDADLIFPGQYFYIPKAGGAERAAAIDHAKNRGAWSIGETEASDLDYLSN